MPGSFVFVAASVLAGLNQAAGQPAVFVSRPGQIVRLVDLNGDGDFLEYGETSVHAEGLPADLGAIAANADRLFVVDRTAARILVVRDLNGDGDALDYGEAAVYAELPGGGVTPIAAGLACQSDGTLFAADAAAGKLYRFKDLNGDGDALDLDETALVATGMTGPSAIAFRPDGRLLLAENSFDAPVRILFDRSGDGNFTDFAENISYAEEITPGQDLTAPQDRTAYLTRPSAGWIVKLHDWTGDDDVLDNGEVVVHAEGLPSPYAIAAAGAGDLLVACRDSAGSVYRVFDRNGDGDALDYGEVLVVAVGLNQPGGIAYVAGATCRKGDINGNGTVDINDVAPFVQILLGNVTPQSACPADCNGDGKIDGADIQQFVVKLTTG